MKYKLIKEYPNSPKLNTILVHDWGMYYKKENDNDVARYNDVIFERYPEFWEKVVEKDYEILSVIGNNGHPIPKTIVKQQKLGGYPNLDGHAANTKCWDILSVKRLSDDEIFTIGDKICGHKLEEIFIAPSNKNDLVLSCEGLKRALYLIEDKHLKIDSKPLFTTEDGVEVYTGDTVWHTNLNLGSLKNCVYSSKVEYEEPFKPVKGLYSTKEKAEEYILLNKPCLSILEINQLLLSAGVGLSCKKEKELRDLVKSKIQQSV